MLSATNFISTGRGSRNPNSRSFRSRRAQALAAEHRLPKSFRRRGHTPRTQGRREIGQAAALMLALAMRAVTQIVCGNYAAAIVQADELVALADEGTMQWRAYGMMNRGCLLAIARKAPHAVLTVALSSAEAAQETGLLLRAQSWGKGQARYSTLLTLAGGLRSCG
jgi:hypothetical protein